MYYFKKSFTFYIFLGFTAIFVRSIIQTASEHYILSIILNACNLLVYGAFSAMEAYKLGQNAYKTLLANDLNRREIVRTGEDLPIKKTEEYRPLKGLIIGLVVSGLAIIATLLYLIVLLAGGDTGTVGGILEYVGMPIYGLLVLIINTGEIPALAIAIIPLNLLIIEISYYIGAKKLDSQQQQIKDIKEQIYGKKD